MTREAAINKLIETKTLSTELLEPLGIGFEAWLQFAQLPEHKAESITRKLIKKYEKELEDDS